MSEFDDHPDLSSYEYLKEQLTLFRECSDDRDFLAAHQELLQKILLRSLNIESLFHDGVATLIAVAPFAYRQQDQSGWQHITWDALLGALNLRDGVMQANMMNLLSRFHMLEGRHEMARKNVETAIERASEENNDLALIWAYIRFFELLVYQPADFSRQEVIQQALTLADDVNHIPTSNALHYALAHFYNRWGDYARALGHGQVAYAFAHSIRNNQAMTKAAYLLVGICRSSGSPSAKHFLKAAEKINDTQLSLFDQVIIIFHQSALYYDMGQHQAAADGYRDALDLLKHLERPVHMASCLQGLALAEIRLKLFNEAQTHLEQAEELWVKHGSVYEHANLRFTQGYLEAWRGNPKFALRLLDDALHLTDNTLDNDAREELRTLILDFRTKVETGTLE